MYGSTKVVKSKVDVQVELYTGKQFLGAFFLRRNQRISDVLNDERVFLPVETTDGQVIQLHKGTIAKVTPLDRDLGTELVQDPYVFLGLSDNVTDGEVESTYLRRAKSYHPDMIQAMGLPAEFVEAANTQLARINEAYERILEERKEEEVEEDESAEEGEPVAD
jgi:hypothetical protein